MSATATHQPKTIFSGIQPTGNLHLGNLLGAILRWVRMQEEAPCLFFLADLHSLSDHIPAEARRTQVRAMAAALIASGIDPDKAILFAQSDVSAHAELCWMLNGTARMGWLSRMTQWKDKSGKNKEGASVALFDYPLLQAADILLYRPSHVPVGEDQKQHIELTRDIATKFNLDTGTETFVLPQPFIGGGVAARVMSLRDGSAKMSKSDPSDMSRINLIDSDDEIATKIRKARTDAAPLPGSMAGLKDRPEARNLVNIYAALTGEAPDAVCARFEGQGFGAFKPALAEVAVGVLSPITTRMKALMADPAEIDRILLAGAERADAVAAPIVADAREIMGMIRGAR